MITVIAHWIVKSGEEANVRRLLETVVAESRREKGNLRFEAYHREERQILLFEQFADLEAVQVHRDTEHFQKIVLGQIVPLLDQRTVEVLRPA